MKGQINFEFLAAAGLFLITILGLITSNQVLPSYGENLERMTLTRNAEQLTDQLMREEGLHSYGSGGTNWEKNSSTLENIEAVGLASDYHVLQRDKIESLKTVTVRGATKLNYSVVKDLTGFENQFRLEFVWLPTVETFNSFTKGSPPTNPNIVEPDTSEYANADNTVHYGSVNLKGLTYNFLVTSHDGSYDSAYVRQGSWIYQGNTEAAEPYTVGEKLRENDFYIESFQNRKDNRGALVVIRKKIHSFGPSTPPKTEVISIDRFGVLGGEPVRMEVLSW